MIESPIKALKQRRGETLGVVFLFVLSFFLPGVILIAAERTHDHAEEWLLAYQPMLYVQEGASVEQVASLQDELSRWPGVKQVVKHDRKDALKVLSESLGEERVNHLGISESMLPTSLEVVPNVPLQGHIELASKVAALEVRDEVAAVDVPDKDALRLMSFVRTISLGAIMMLLMMCATALLLGRAYLRRIQDDEGDMSEILEVFGASHRSLSKPTMHRALMLSVWSGGLASVALFIAQLNLDRWASGIFGTDAMVPLTWLVVFLPLISSPFIGFMLGKMAVGFDSFKFKRSTGFADIQSLLRFTRQELPVTP